MFLAIIIGIIFPRGSSNMSLKETISSELVLLCRSSYSHSSRPLLVIRILQPAGSGAAMMEPSSDRKRSGKRREVILTWSCKETDQIVLVLVLVLERSKFPPKNAELLRLNSEISPQKTWILVKSSRNKKFSCF